MVCVVVRLPNTGTSHLVWSIGGAVILQFSNVIMSHHTCFYKRKLELTSRFTKSAFLSTNSDNCYFEIRKQNPVVSEYKDWIFVSCILHAKEEQAEHYSTIRPFSAWNESHKNTVHRVRKRWRLVHYIMILREPEWLKITWNVTTEDNSFVLANFNILRTLSFGRFARYGVLCAQISWWKFTSRRHFD